MSNIDFLIVGAGLYGATIARLLTDRGYKCLVIDKRNHIAGNIYSEKINGYHKHIYGPHIFHTSNSDIINFVNKYSEWIPYQQNTLATDGEKLYHLPFNMNTYYDIFGITDPEDAKQIIENEITYYLSNKKNESIKNLEEYAKSTVGTTIYEKLIKNYTEKQWGKKCTELSPDIIKRLPLRFSYSNNYFNDTFQAIPKDGYTNFVDNILTNILYICDIEFKPENYSYWKDHVKYNIIYCGAVDELLDYKLGELKWRSLRFEDKSYQYNGYNGQGTAIVNDVSKIPYTRCVEHMWFTPNNVKPGITSIQTFEFPDNWSKGKECYYAINNDNTEKKYQEYVDLLNKEMPKIILGGRLGKYRYFDMDDTIYEAMIDVEKIINKYND